MTTPATNKAVDLPRVQRTLTRLEAHLERHPEVRDRTARYFAGELQAERPTAYEFARLECSECSAVFLTTLELLNHADRDCPAMRRARREQRRLRRRGRR